MSLGRRLISTAGAADVSLFKVVLYTGNASTKSVTGVGFQPDLVWIKNRSSTSNYFHALIDSVRGIGQVLSSNASTLDTTTYSDQLTSFDADGFSLGNNSSGGNYVNLSGDDYVAWCFKGGGSAVSNSDGSVASTVSANSDAGFSIVKWNGNGTTSQTVGHGLSSAPQVVIMKSISGNSAWYVLTTAYSTINPAYLQLESTAQANSGTFTSTSTTFTNFAYGGDTIAYCFAETSGFSKIDSYTGTGSSLTIYTTDDSTSSGSNPFAPSFLIIKRVDSADAWQMYDNQRGVTKQLMAQSADAEYTQDGTSLISFNSNGFTLGVDNSERVNKASAKYLFMAFK